MAYSNRVLTDKINKENPFIRLLVNENGLFEEYKVLRFKDIKSGSSFSESDDSSGEMSIELTEVEMFEELIQLVNAKPVFFELLLNEVNVNARIFNKFYVVNMSLFEFNVLDNKKMKTLNLISFTDMYERNTIAEHTVEYNFDVLPVDPDTGDKIMPEDYNTIRFEYSGSTGVESTLSELWARNMLINSNGTIQVQNRCKGDSHVYDPTRAADGITFDGVYDALNQGAVTYTSNKKSVYEIRESLYGISKSRGNKTRHVLEMYYDSPNKRVCARFVARPDIDITFDKSQDRFQFYRNETTRNGDIVDVLTESDGKDNLSANVISNPKPWQMKRLEGLNTISVKIDDPSAQDLLISSAEEMAGSNEVVDVTEIELFFRDRRYFLDIKAGQVVNISGYSSLIDGEYFIRKISGVLNESYISYSLETLERSR